MSASFDALKYFEDLKAAGMPEKVARVQADAMRLQTDAQAAAFRDFAYEQDEKARRELATKGDIQEVRLEIEKVRAEIKDTELRLQKEIREVEMRLLKWQWGIALALAAIMAKGFGWLGF